MAINFNTDPYYDDFDPNKNYHRILFKPGRAVQARELTQLQTILQNQISNFADAIFAKNTPVTGGKVTLNFGCFYIKLNNQFEEEDIIASNLLNALITDVTGSIVARVIATAESTGEGGDPPTLIVSYLSGSQFTDGLVIYSFDGTTILATTIGTVGGTTCSGRASVASITQGVFYVVNGYNISTEQNQDDTFSRYSIGNFVSVQPSTIILSKYSAVPSARIGLLITETYIDYVDSPDLLDPTLGSSNYQAPGADRYIIDLTLTAFSFQLVNDQNFIELVRVENGIITRQVDDTVYSKIDDYFAKRTYDTNGDYIVNDFKLGTSANTINPDIFELSIGKGIAYVRGYRIENQYPFKIAVNRAREFDTQDNNNIFINYGNFLYTDNVKGSAIGSFDITDMNQVDIHCVALANVSTANANTYNSTLVATSRIRNLDYMYFSNTITDTSSYVYKMYVFDTLTTTLTSNASAITTNTISFFDRTGKFSSANGAYVGATITMDSGTTVSGGTSSIIIEYNGLTKTATIDPPFAITPASPPNFTIKFQIKDAETIVRANSNNFIMASASINKASKIGNIPSGDVVIQDTTRPELLFPLGNSYVKTLKDKSYESQKYFRNKLFTSVSTKTQLSITLPPSLNFKGRTQSQGNLTDSEATSLFTVIVRNRGNNSGLTNGQILNFANDANSYITIADSKLTATFTKLNLDAADFRVDIIAKVFVSNADEISTVLRGKDLIKAANSQVYISGTTVAAFTKVDLTYGQVYIEKAGIVAPGKKQSLFVSDVKKIVKIIDTQSAATSPTNSMLVDSTYDVTANYNFNNGQTDNYYDHATITLKNGAPKAKGNLLVLFDYYSPTGSSGDGYFDVTSYLASISSKPEKYEEIPTYVSKNGSSYSLRDCLDFRPTRKNAVSNFTFAFTGDQTSSDVGALIPSNLSTFVNDYSYYLPRKDILILSKDKNFQVINGTSSTNPKFPVEPDGALLLARITLDAYTSYVAGETPPGILPNVSIEPVQHKRFTMQDIANIQKRINNIEFYTVLNALEQKAQSAQIPDVNGLNRFKNGILVDDFSSFATAATGNPDFTCSINKRTNQLTAQQDVSNFALQSEILLLTLNKPNPDLFNVFNINKTNIFSLPYTSSSVTNQQYATSILNVNPFAISVAEGVLDINPPMDNWVDNTQLPDLVITDKDIQIYQEGTTVNPLQSGDWQTLPGTAITTSTSRVDAAGGTTVTTSSYVTKNQTSISGTYDRINNTYSINNNYITDISIEPYIRPQQISIRAKGLKINTPVTCTFDGQLINSFVTTPDIIELKNCTGIFKDDDVIGFTYDSKFLPVAEVASAYYYPGTANCRIYIRGNYLSTYPSIGTGAIHNAFFNTTTGNYETSTAQGRLVTESFISVHRSGFVTSAGNSIQDYNGTILKYYRVTPPLNNFAQSHGIWSNPNQKGTTLAASKFQINWLLAVGDQNKTRGPFYVMVSSSPGQTGTFKFADRPPISTSGNTANVTITFNQNTSTANVELSSTGVLGTNEFFAAAISDQPWIVATVDSSPSTKGNIIFSTASSLLTVSPDPVFSPGSVLPLKGGGIYYSAVTKISLSGSASVVNDYYRGCKINIITKNVVEITDPKDKNKKILKLDPTNSNDVIITGYDAANSSITLDRPVPISIGVNRTFGDLTSSYTISGTQFSYKKASQMGPPQLETLSTNESGVFNGIFNVPSGIFKTGDRVLTVETRAIESSPETATSFAKGTFTASGLSTRSQALDFGISIAGAKKTFTQTKTLYNQLVNQTIRYFAPPGKDPIAQTFIFQKDNYPNGLFLESISLFFQSKPTQSNDPITLSIVGTQNGYPDGETLDYSIVTLYANQVKVMSTTENLHYLNPNASTVFKFDAPVYIQSGILYAFILESPSTEYNLYIAAKDKEIFPSTAKTNLTDPNPTGVQKLGMAPYIGGLFESQNGITWVADPAKSLMMDIKRCKFSIGSRIISFVVPKNLPYRKSATTTISYNANPVVVVNVNGDYPQGNVVSCAYNITTTDFIPDSTNISYSYVSKLLSTGDGVGPFAVAPGKFGCPTIDNIYLSDGLGERVLLKNLNDSFKLFATLTTQNDVLSPMLSDDGLTLYNIEWKINNLGLLDNQIIIVDDGGGYDSNARVIVSAPDLPGGTQASANLTLSSGNVESIFITTPGSGYLNPPTITVTGPNTNTAIVTTTSEFSPRGGNADCRYITKTVVLAPGNDSQDLRVYYTAYRPLGTNIYVFYKLLSSGDDSIIDDNSWQLMTNVGGNKEVFSKTRDNIYEFEAAPGTGGLADNYITYVSANGQTYNSFIQFAIKIVMTSADRTTVPVLTSLRAIALPSGTGL
jgi:hypothetical protein